MKKRILSLLIFSCALCCPPVFSQESSASQDFDSAWEQVKEDARQFWSDLTGALQDAGRSVDSQLKELSVSVFAGKWQFVNGKYSTVIECRDDGTMTVEQTARFGSKQWDGTYEVKVGSVVFSVQTVTDGVLFRSTKQREETWTIQYAPSGLSDMRFSSDDIPDDANGYDFSAVTLFTAVE